MDADLRRIQPATASVRVRNQSCGNLVVLATALALIPAAGFPADKPQAPGKPRAPIQVSASDPARVTATMPIKEALRVELGKAGRLADQVNWLDIEQGQAMLVALRKNLAIQSAELNKDLSAAALQQALALFDPVLTQSLTYNRSDTYGRVETDSEFKGAITCVAGICTKTLGNQPGVYSITFDEGRNAGFYQTDVDASVAPDAGPIVTNAYNARIVKLFPKGISASAADSVVYRDTMFVENIGTSVIGSYERPWTNQLSFAAAAPLPGSKFFGDYAAADISLRIADVNQQAAFWRIAGLINDTLLQVERAYWNLVLGQKIYEVTVDTHQRIRALAEKTTTMFQAQEATRYAKAKIDAQLASLRRQEHEALNNYLVASNALANLLDLERKTILLPKNFETSLRDSPAIEMQNALRQANERNPQIHLGEVNKSIAAMLYEQGRSQLRPDVSATANAGVTQNNSVFGYQTPVQALTRTFRPDSINQSYSLSYTRPWDNRAANANFAQSESRYRQQEILFDQTRRNITSQVTLAVTRLRSAQQRTLAAKQSRDLAETVFDRAERQRSLGVVNAFEVITKSVDLLNADLDYQTALLVRKIAEAETYAAMGTLAQRYGVRSGQ